MDDDVTAMDLGYMAEECVEQVDTARLHMMRIVKML